jgi:hypothetical protein
MIDSNNVLSSYGIKKDSVGAAIYQIGKDIDDSTDPLSFANAIIMELGGAEQMELDVAKIVAKALIEQAIVQEKYNSVVAMSVAETKLQKIKDKMGYVFAKPEDSGFTVQPINQPVKTNNKKDEAKKIFDANKAMSNGEIAQLISKQLNITYGNAFYYTSRVFKR